MSERRKQLKEQYKARKVVGGIFRINNTKTGRYYLADTDNMQSTMGWFSFSQSLDNCTLPAIQQDWKQYGKDAFTIEELEQLEKGETQTDAEFREDLKVLLEYWQQKLPAENRY